MLNPCLHVCVCVCACLVSKHKSCFGRSSVSRSFSWSSPKQNFCCLAFQVTKRSQGLLSFKPIYFHWFVRLDWRGCGVQSRASSFCSFCRDWVIFWMARFTSVKESILTLIASVTSLKSCFPAWPVLSTPVLPISIYVCLRHVWKGWCASHWLVLLFFKVRM